MRSAVWVLLLLLLHALYIQLYSVWTLSVSMLVFTLWGIYWFVYERKERNDGTAVALQEWGLIGWLEKGFYFYNEKKKTMECSAITDVLTSRTFPLKIARSKDGLTRFCFCWIHGCVSLKRPTSRRPPFPGNLNRWMMECFKRIDPQLSQMLRCASFAFVKRVSTWLVSWCFAYRSHVTKSFPLKNNFFQDVPSLTRWVDSPPAVRRWIAKLYWKQKQNRSTCFFFFCISHAKERVQ